MKAALVPASRFCECDIGCRHPAEIRATQRFCEFIFTFARGSLANAFVAEVMLGLATTAALIERLSMDRALRRASFGISTRNLKHAELQAVARLK